MHRPTISAYDRGAEHWLATRYESESADTGVATGFRVTVGAAGIILDLGCGPGELLPQLGPATVGIDASIEMLKIAHARGRGPLLCGDIEALPIADGATAGAFANFSMQHLPRSAFPRAVREIARALKPGGHFELAVHNHQRPDGVRENDDIPGGRWFTYWAREDLVSVLAAEGFDVVDIDDVGFAHRVRARRRGGSTVRSRQPAGRR